MAKLSKARIILKKAVNNINCSISIEETKTNYIYQKIHSGYNYIIAPRRSGKTRAVALLDEIDGYSVFNCVKTSASNFFNMRGLVRDKLVLDEFEFMTYDDQIMCLEQYRCQPIDFNWVFVSSPRNISLVEGETSVHRDHLLNHLINTQRIKKFVIDEKLMKKISKTLGL